MRAYVHPRQLNGSVFVCCIERVDTEMKHASRSLSAHTKLCALFLCIVSQKMSFCCCCYSFQGERGSNGTTTLQETEELKSERGAGLGWDERKGEQGWVKEEEGERREVEIAIE